MPAPNRSFDPSAPFDDLVTRNWLSDEIWAIDFENRCRLNKLNKF